MGYAFLLFLFYINFLNIRKRLFSPKSLKLPLTCNRRYGIKTVVLSGFRIHEIITDFNLRTNTQLEIVTYPSQRSQIKPKLRFRHQDEIPVHGIIVPQIDKTAERTQASGKTVSPNACQLPAMTIAKYLYMACTENPLAKSLLFQL